MTPKIFKKELLESIRSKSKNKKKGLDIFPEHEVKLKPMSRMMLSTGKEFMQQNTSRLQTKKLAIQKHKDSQLHCMPSPS